MAKELRSHLPELVDKYNLELSRKGLGREHRLTHQKLADETGIARTTISRVYRNTFTRLDKKTITALCEFFNCDLTDLLMLVEVEHPPRKAKRKNKK